MAALWFEKSSEKSVWHLADATVGKGRYRMACGWELELQAVRRLWPVKTGEAGPPRDDRCHACVEADPERGLG